MSARITVTDEMIERGREAREEHYLRVSPVSCTCGWQSGTHIEADGLPRFEAHLVELALEAAGPLIAAQALRDALARLGRAAYAVDSTHHFHGIQCSCGFTGDARKRTQTEHITTAVLEAYDHD